MGFTGGLEKLLVEAFLDEGFDTRAKPPSLRLWINPDKYTRTSAICYNERTAQGSPGGSPDFNRVPSEKMKLELVFDGTGVIPTPLPGVQPFTGDGIAEQIAEFRSLVFNYDGRIHSPRYLRLTWGTLCFQCRLTELSLTYTLFKPDGTPLRARGDATFLEFASTMARSAGANQTSPDMTHVLTVAAGDTLPLMCWRVYGDSGHYVMVARVNRLTDVRDLRVGTQLVFPPLEAA